MVGLSTAVEVPKGKRYKHNANRIVILSALYRSQFVKPCANEFQKITQTLTDYALANDGHIRYLLV